MSISARDARALNGTSASALDAVRALERATCTIGLDALSVLAWRGVLSTVNSLAPTQQWCPDCLNQWRTAQAEVHYPLLWCLNTARWCELHDRPLARHCCRCGAPVRLLGTPGWCPTCFGWLGEGRAQPHPDASAVDPLAGMWFARASAVLLERGQCAGRVPTPDYMHEVWTWLFTTVGAGHWEGLRRRLGLPSDMLFRWRTGTSLPSIDMFLTLCWRFKLEPADLLTPDRLASLEPAAIVEGLSDGIRAAPRKPNVHPDLRRVRRLLRRALRCDLVSARPLEQVAQDLGVGSQLLRYHFPELASAISARWRLGCREGVRGR